MIRLTADLDINDFISRQLEKWDEAATRFDKLGEQQTRTIVTPSGIPFKVTYNPSRMRSTAAKVDKASIAARPCFLCSKNRPVVQDSISLGDYELLLNPFPIFPRHLTIPAREHIEQAISGRASDMAAMALLLNGFTLFYNGAKCGASAPDHFHFQAVPEESLPLLDRYPFAVIRFAASIDEAEDKLTQALDRLPVYDGEAEPRVNILCRANSGSTVEFVIIPRRRHRPGNYGEDDGQMLLSPASVDLGGTIVAPRQKEFDTLDGAMLQALFDEVCYREDELFPAVPKIAVGVLTAEQVTLTFDKGFSISGSRTFKVVDGDVIDIEDGSVAPESYVPVQSTSQFTVKNVVIGIGFHWEQQLDQSFAGACRLVADGDNVVVINDIAVEDYLKSVISSEMSANASQGLLRAHAVISRSWALAQIRNRAAGSKAGSIPNVRESRDGNDENSVVNGELEIIRWYDHDDHSLFDVCADDHCQRYQGVSRITNTAVDEAVEATHGIVLTDDCGRLCDARFSKCCGGVTEVFSSCWQPRDFHYLKAISDAPGSTSIPDLTVETNAREWVESRPDAWCKCNEKSILTQVLNGFDQLTTDFYRWTIVYTATQISDIVRRRSGLDFGEITNLYPIERGPSGRIIKLKIEGTKMTAIVGKELEIRRWLSESHLYSSAFVVEKSVGQDDEVVFTLHGAGWGHGVGLCQIGAAVMGTKGIPYTDILAHYYPGASLSHAY